MEKSNVEKQICSKDFEYMQPYLYNNPYALRCELGIGKSDREFSKNAKKRAKEIYNILFSKGVDAVIFNYWMYDYSDTGEAEIRNYDKEKDALYDINEYVKKESKQLKLLLEYQMKYRHMTIENLKTYLESEDEDYGKQRRNRIICFSDGKEFNIDKIIELQLSDKYNFEFGLVSFENECIYSVYDDRGCDVVFFSYDKMKEFYNTLKPYFLSYDVEEMERRYNKK